MNKAAIKRKAKALLDKIPPPAPDSEPAPGPPDVLNQFREEWAKLAKPRPSKPSRAVRERLAQQAQEVPSQEGGAIVGVYRKAN